MALKQLFKRGGLLSICLVAFVIIPQPSQAELHFSPIDGGLTFQDSVRVDDAPAHTDQIYPEVAVDQNNNVYTVWNDARNSDSPDIYFSRNAFMLKTPRER